MDLQATNSRLDLLKILKPEQNLLAVSKLQSEDKIKALAAEGQIHFGENYVQEALEKIENLVSLSLQWHLIGPLQKNKVKFLQKNFAYIHSVNSLELAQLISSKAEALQHRQKIFLQVNLSNESSKAGFSEATLLQLWPQLKELSGIQIVGLMTMPPLENEPEKNRPYFQTLKKLGAQLHLKEFSMGTSQDFLVALKEGSTWIRIGTMLFGDREIKPTRESRTP